MANTNYYKHGNQRKSGEDGVQNADLEFNQSGDLSVPTPECAVAPQRLIRISFRPLLCTLKIDLQLFLQSLLSTGSRDCVFSIPYSVRYGGTASSISGALKRRQQRYRGQVTDGIDCLYLCRKKTRGVINKTGVDTLQAR